jgi:putative nucleotidyltransferase with HDIG domain
MEFTQYRSSEGFWRCDKTRDTQRWKEEVMEQFKEFILDHFEKILIGIILIAAFAGTYFVEEKSVILNFYYLPVLFSAYFMGRRMGVLTAIFSILAVLICGLFFPSQFFGDNMYWQNVTKLSSWAGFLILASTAVGTLYEKHEHRLQDLKRAYIGILEILSKYIESTDRYTKGHSVRVSEMAMEIAIAMQLPRGEVENIRVAGLLHDIGKIEISGDILRKAAELSEEERELMNSHTVKGAYILSAVGSVLKEVVPIVAAHHKFFLDPMDSDNGDRLKIPLGARIVAVADAFDAMTTDRPYRKGTSPWEALQEIVAKTGKQFDPEVVGAFKCVVSEKMEMS